MKGNPIGYGHEGDAETARLTWNTKIETDTCLRQWAQTLHSIGFSSLLPTPTAPVIQRNAIGVLVSRCCRLMHPPCTHTYGEHSTATDDDDTDDKTDPPPPMTERSCEREHVVVVDTGGQKEKNGNHWELLYRSQIYECFLHLFYMYVSADGMRQRCENPQYRCIPSGSGNIFPLPSDLHDILFSAKIPNRSVEIIRLSIDVLPHWHRMGKPSELKRFCHSQNRDNFFTSGGKKKKLFFLNCEKNSVLL